MSLVNVRVNTTTFTWRPFLPSLSQNKLLKWAFVKMEQSQLIIQDFKQSSKHTAERNLIWVKQATAHLFLSFMVRERWKERCARVSHFLCLFKWEQKHRRKKKEEVSASHKPSALFLPQHPRCLLSSLSSSCTSFFFYDLPLLWIIQSHTLLGSHQLSHSQRCAAV